MTQRTPVDRKDGSAGPASPQLYLMPFALIRHCHPELFGGALAVAAANRASVDRQEFTDGATGRHGGPARATPPLPDYGDSRAKSNSRLPAAGRARGTS